MSPNNVSRTSLSVLFAATLLAAECARAQNTAAPQAQLPPVVGEATLVIGQAQLLGANGTTRLMERGTPVRVGDQLQTQAGGHVYLRFVDGANLSVRPMSRMHIESYSHNAQQPQLGAIKFRLDEGTARSITGAWGEAARERFRLNTPVAAIGVKGTDFTVRSDAAGTTATVYTGAIVLAPLTTGCAAVVGPCHTGFETQLTADMRGQMLQLTENSTAPLLVAAAAHVTRQPRAQAPADRLFALAPNSDLSESRSEPTANSKTLGSETRAANVAVLEVPAPPPPAAAEPPAPPPPPVPAPAPAPAPVVAQPEAPAPPPTPTGPPVVTQLGWLRTAWTPAMDADRFVQTLGSAARAGMETVVTGNGAYVLQRDPNATTTQQPLYQAVVDFRLAGASAHLLPPEAWKQAEPVAVQSGSLQVDFSRSLFQTALAMQSATLGNQSISAGGAISATGHMVGNSGDATLAGAITPDQAEAGYFFQKTLPQGALRGVTLWGR